MRAESGEQGGPFARFPAPIPDPERQPGRIELLAAVPNGAVGRAIADQVGIDGAAVVAELQDAGIFITLPQPLQILESERVRRCCDPERLRQVAVERAERLNPVERAGSTVTSAARNQR